MSYEKELLHLEYKEKSTFKRYLSFYRKDKLNLFLTLILFLIKQIPAWLTPIISANIINEITNPNGVSLHYMIVQFCIGIVFILENIPGHMAYIWFFSRVSRRVELELRMSLCTRLQHLSIPFHTNSKMGHVQTKVLRDVENIEMLSKMLVSDLPSAFCAFFIAIFVTCQRAPLFLVFYVLVVPIAVTFSFYFRKKIRETNRDFRISMESMSGKIIEMLRLITVTRAHSVEDDALIRVGSKLQEVRQKGSKLDNTTSIFGSVNWVIFMVFNLTTVFVAAILKYKGVISIGIGDIFLLGQFFGSLSSAILQLLNLVPNIAKGFESVNSVCEILECPDIEENENKVALSNVTGNIEFKDMSFSYESTDKIAINKFSFKVNRGDTIALVGPSGSGKSTIMQLLIGFIRPTSGQLLIDGLDVNEIDMRSYRKFISVVSQESIFFDGTIYENITYGAHDFTQEDVDNAIKNANLYEFVQTLPDGLNTQIKEGGTRLSGGQKQRLSIARALIRDPQVLLLDEATSALDVESEILIQEALERLIKGRTTFVVAHRLSTIRNANKIIVLKDGVIAENGSHNELINKHGIYYQMVQLQNSDKK